MWSEVLYALVAAVLLYAFVSVALKVIGRRRRPAGDLAVDGQPRTGNVGSQRPE